MARAIRRLNVAKIKSISARGMYADGDGLYLQVRNENKSWVYRYMLAGRARTMGLGPIRFISLAEARSLAAEAKRLLLQGIDPIEQRKRVRSHLNAPTFDRAAADYIESQMPGWKSKKHAKQWTSTIRTYVSPFIGAMRVAEIGTDDVLRILRPIWEAKPETASRVRGRIEKILDWAKSRGHREGDNPCRWAGHLEHSLPPTRRLKSVRHFRALPWINLPSFYEELETQKGVGAQALMLTILTATRTGEVLGACRSEFDLDCDIPTWTVPGRRMKSGTEHRVPLAPEAVGLVRSVPVLDPEIVFASRPNRSLCQDSMRAVLTRMNRTDITVHGFRSTFRDWCADMTGTQREVAEAALAHVNKDRVEAAYRRSDLFKKRYVLMKKWAKFASQGRNSNVVSIPNTRVS